MPNLPTHIFFALDAINDLNVDFLGEYIEPYMLGATSPDIRALTKKDRAIYHFVDFSLLI